MLSAWRLRYKPLLRRKAPLLLCLSLVLILTSLVTKESIILPLCTGLFAACAASGFIARRKGMLAVSSVLIIFSALSLITGFVGETLIRGRFEEYSTNQIETAAGAIQARFERLLESLDEVAFRQKEQLLSLGAENITSSNLISAQNQYLKSGTGIALFPPRGEVYAWNGDIPILDAWMLNQNKKPYLLRKSRNSYLYRLLVEEESGWIITTGLRLDAALFGRELRYPSVTVTPIDFRETSIALSERFEGAGDRLWAGSRGNIPTLHFPLRSPEGDVLVVLSVTGSSLSSELARLNLWSRIASGLALAGCLGCAALCLLRITERSRRPTLRSCISWTGFAASLVLLRLALYLYVPLDRLLPSEIFSPDKFASTRLLGLLRSPGDTFLTALFAFLLILTGLRLLLRRHRWQKGIPTSRTLFWGLSIFSPLLSLSLVLWYQGFLAEGVRNTDLDLLDFSLLPFSPQGFCVKFGLASLLGVVVLIICFCLIPQIACAHDKRTSLYVKILSWLGWILFPLLFLLINQKLPLPRSLLISPMSARISLPLLPSVLIYLAPVPLAFMLTRLSFVNSKTRNRRWAAIVTLLLILLPVALYFSIFHHEFRTRQSLVCNTVKPAVEAQKGSRRFMLKHILRELPSRLAEGLPLEKLDELAFAIWSDSPLATYGYSSAVDVFDEEGQLVSSFSFNLPVETAVAPRPSQVPTSVEEVTVSFGMRRTRIIRGWRRIDAGLEFPLYVVFRISEGYDDLPFFRRPDRLHDLVLSRHRASTIAMRESPSLVLMAFDEEGYNLYSTLFDAPVPELPMGRPIMYPIESGWLTLTNGRSKTDLFLFQADDLLFAVGFHRKNAREHAVDLINIVILALALALLTRLILFLASAESLLYSPSGMVNMVTSRFSRKLFASLLMVALIPMILLSFYLKGYVYSVKVREIEDSAKYSVETSRRIVEEYLSTFKDDPGTIFDRVDDPLLIWIGGLTHHDLSLFRGSQLHATNIRGIYLSEELPSRINGAVFEQIYQDHKIFVSRKIKKDGLILLEVSVPVTVDGRTPSGILSLTSALREEDIRKEAAAFNEVLFVVGALLGTVIFLLSYSLSKKISGPIQNLTVASSEIARGNFGLELEAASKDEIRSLVESFNLMAGNIKEREDDLKREKETIERIIRNATTGVLAVDPEHRISTINPAAIEILGVSGSAFIGERIMHLLDQHPGLERLVGFLKNHLGKSPAEIGSELRISRKADERTIRVMVVPIPESREGSGKEGTVILLEDVTEILRSEKLKTWAELSRKIAHEVKNPLTPIKLAVDHLRTVHSHGDADLPAVLDKCCATILKQVENLRKLSLDFLNLSTEREPVREPVNISSFLNEVLAPYQNSPPPGISFVIEAIRDLPDVRIDPELMQRALINLIENAIQALSNEGVVTLRAQRAVESGKDYVRITVADTGSGIKDDARSRLFEPSFSTKSTGTGLGLAIARKIITDHGGILRLDPVSEHGASFSILLKIESF
ncbi:ATP-binding protein [Acidobacteriota bacterium]